MMDKQLAQSFRNRWQAVVRIQEEEDRVSTLEQRWRAMNAILGLALSLKLPLASPDDSATIVMHRWNKLRGL